MSRIQGSFPIEDGFKMPGEFEEHDSTYMIWPQRPDNWRLGGKPAQKVFARVADEISKYERVVMLANDDQYVNARNMCSDRVNVIEMSNNDSWARDCGATFVSNGTQIRGIDWSFNAWGGLVDGLYFPWDKDDQVASKMCEIESADSYRLDNFVLEGGSIHVDGEGTLVTTEECLLSKGRNPHYSKEEIEKVLMNYLGISKIIWLQNGIYLDETNGHVDNIFQFVEPGKVILAWTDDKNDPQYPICVDAFEKLSSETDAQGRKFEIHKLLLPSPILISKEESEGVDAVDGTLPREEGDRLAASYANFYIANSSVFVPQFNDKNDGEAIRTLKNLFPDRDVIGIYAREILLGGGNIHCITQQIPAKKK